WRAEVTILPREKDVTWTLRVTSVAPREGAPLPPINVELRLEADARTITAHERELMEWREKIDPIRQPEAVRQKIAELTDAEVRFYTGFKDRENFLKLWKRVTADELPPDPENGMVEITEENRGLFIDGNPLPDGRFLHH